MQKKMFFFKADTTAKLGRIFMSQLRRIVLIMPYGVKRHLIRQVEIEDQEKYVTHIEKICSDQEKISTGKKNLLLVDC